jgi:hypothetical protein
MQSEKLSRYSDGPWAGHPDSVFHTVKTGLRAPWASYSICTGGTFLGVKQPGRETEHSHLCTAEVKNGDRISSTPSSASNAWHLVNSAHGQLHLFHLSTKTLYEYFDTYLSRQEV